MNRVLLVCGSVQRSSVNQAAVDAARRTPSASGAEVSASGALAMLCHRKLRHRKSCAFWIAWACLLGAAACSKKGPDASEGASGGAAARAATFSCGTAACSSSEYCVAFTAEPGSPSQASCKPLPPACIAAPSCTCLGRSPRDRGQACDDSGGQVTITHLPGTGATDNVAASASGEPAQGDIAATDPAAVQADTPGMPASTCRTAVDCTATPWGSPAGSELAAPRWGIACVAGRCVTPRSTSEWEATCEARKPATLTPGASLSLGEFGKCIQQAAFSSVMAGGRAGGVSHYDEALGICDRHLGDESEFCKLQVCDNLGFADGNMSRRYPEKEACQREATKNSTCTDGKRNGFETGIDCGGPSCPPCSPSAPGSKSPTASTGCRAHSDCSSGFCGLHGVEHRDQCYPLCPDGPISEHEPCGCYQTVTPQGLARPKPVPNDHDTHGAESWEGQYGGGRRVFCCGGREAYLTKGQSCSSVP